VPLRERSVTSKAVQHRFTVEFVAGPLAAVRRHARVDLEVGSLRRHLLRYTEILRSSVFSDVEVISIEVERTWTPDELIGMTYSTAAFSPERLGERMSIFEQRVREELAASYREKIAVDAVIGRQRVA
jgi:hypothetical protein